MVEFVPNQLRVHGNGPQILPTTFLNQGYSLKLIRMFVKSNLQGEITDQIDKAAYLQTFRTGSLCGINQFECEVEL